MAHSYSRRRIGIPIAMAALTFGVAACGSSGSKTTATTAGTGTPGTTASGTSGSIKKGLVVYFIPKDTQNPYEVIADQGGATALKDLGGKVVVSSGTADTAAAQIPSIQAAIQAHADAIVIAGNDPSALCPSLSQAQAAGIKVVSFDSDVTCANHLFI
ncbi:MAG: rhamnose transport system substrate-binding protein, partial [Acidimicrobiaceae bacterium]|nr:rhamnose transport system substrate-binding protein [Acidimicrobiaceae bacterium]